MFFPEIQTYLVEQLPIKNISKDQQQSIIDLVNEILIAKTNGNNITDLEKKIDNRVYELYDLTKEEIEIIESCFIFQ